MTLLSQFRKYISEHCEFEYQFTYGGYEYWVWDTGMHALCYITFNEKILRRLVKLSDRKMPGAPFGFAVTQLMYNKKYWRYGLKCL